MVRRGSSLPETFCRNLALAYAQIKKFIGALALRETTAKEKERVGELISIMEAFGG